MSELPVSVELAKQHLRLGDDSSFDSLVAEYLQMAFGIASDFTNRDLVVDFDAQSLPPAIKSAILLILGTLFDNESDTLIGRSALKSQFSNSSTKTPQHPRWMLR